MAESCGRAPVVTAGSYRAEFRARGNKGATSPAATSPLSQAGFSAGPVKRESSTRTLSSPAAPSAFSASTVPAARDARPARPIARSGFDSPGPRSTSPPPTSTTCPGTGPATTVVLKRCPGPRDRRAATAVSSFMLDAGTRPSDPPRSNRTSPVSASWTSAVNVPPPSAFNSGSSCAVTAARAGTSAEGSRVARPGRAESVAGACCHAGAGGAGAGASGPRKPGATSRAAGTERATRRAASRTSSQDLRSPVMPLSAACRTRPYCRSVPIVLVMLVPVLKS